MNDYIELKSAIGTVLRRWWIIALVAIVAGIAGYWISTQQTPVFQAQTSLLVGRPIQSANVDRFDLQTSQALAQTYADLARRQPVLQRAIDELDLDITWSQLRSRVRASGSGDTQLLEIRVEADTPAEAARIVDEVARQLILLSPSGTRTVSQQKAQEFASERAAELRQKVRGGQEQLEALEVLLLETSTDENVTLLNDRIIALETLVSRWESNYLDLLAVAEDSSKANNLAVLEPAQGGQNPVRPNPRLSTLIAMLVGAVLGIGGIFLLEFMDNTLRTPTDLERVLGLGTLGAIEQIKSKNPRDALIVNHDPFSPAYENYRLLRTRVQSMFDDGTGHTVMVTSSTHGEGKSLTVANLGIVMAQAGLKTIIVDANLRQPVMHKLFQLASEDGLTHLLRGQEPNVSRHLSSTMVPNLRVLVSGVLPSNPSELLGSPRMHYLLEQLTEQADIVICDSTDAVTVADALVLSGKVDGVLVVIDAGSTENHTAIQAITNLRDARANLIGAVLNRVSSKRRKTVLSDTQKSTSVMSIGGMQPQNSESFTPLESAGG